MLNGKYQKVEIKNESNCELLINGTNPVYVDGNKIKLERDLQSREVTIKKEGYKDKHVVITQHRRSPLFIISVIPFGILMVPPIMDRFAKSYDFPKEYTIAPPSVKDIEYKEDSLKGIYIEKVVFNPNKYSIKETLFKSFNRYLNNDKDFNKAGIISTGSLLINVDRYSFSEKFNRALARKGYLDTSSRAIKGGFDNTLVASGEVRRINFHTINTRGVPSVIPTAGRLTYVVSIIVKWQVNDPYGDTLSKTSTFTQSGEFSTVEKAFEDALDFSLIAFVNDEKVQELIREKSDLDKEKDFSEIYLPKSENYVKTLGGALKSSVTIKTDKGHGSGFIITDDGYLVTNYHVIANASNLTVVLFDKTEHKCTVERVSRASDLALLKITTNDTLFPIEITKNKTVNIAEEIYAIGTPTAEDLSQTLSKGIISGLRSNGSDNSLIQTDASVNSGNSGGPLVSKDVKVLGVVSAKLKGYGIEGVAFGVPANELLKSLNIVIK